MSDIFVNLIKNYSEQNPIVGDFFKMLEKPVKGQYKSDIKYEEKIRILKLEHEKQYMLFKNLGDVIVIVGVLGRYIRLRC